MNEHILKGKNNVNGSVYFFYFGLAAVFTYSTVLTTRFGLRHGACRLMANHGMVVVRNAVFARCRHEVPQTAVSLSRIDGFVVLGSLLAHRVGYGIWGPWQVGTMGWRDGWMSDSNRAMRYEAVVFDEPRQMRQTWQHC